MAKKQSKGPTKAALNKHSKMVNALETGIEGFKSLVNPAKAEPKKTK